MDSFFEITSKEIRPEDHIARVLIPQHGGIVVFIGTVRQKTGNREVRHLHYEANEELARSVMQKIFEEIEKEWKDVKISVAHRIGENLTPGTTTLVIAVSSPHREAAYTVNRTLLERIKEDLPIWKKEVFIDGSERWIGWNNKN